MISAEELARGRQLLDELKAAQRDLPEHVCPDDLVRDPLEACAYTDVHRRIARAGAEWCRWRLDFGEHMLATIEELQQEKEDSQ